MALEMRVKVLVNDAARAEVEVADLGVAHLPGGQPHILAAGAERAGGIGGLQVVVERGLGKHGGIGVAFGVFGRIGIDAPAVADDEDDR